MHHVLQMHDNAAKHGNASYDICTKMHQNAPDAECTVMQQLYCRKMHMNASYQNATYMNTLVCKRMRKHAADQECNNIECNEILLNASKCS